MTPVTDPAILEQLNAGLKPVTDPAILAQLNDGGADTAADSAARGLPPNPALNTLQPVSGTGFFAKPGTVAAPSSVPDASLSDIGKGLTTYAGNAALSAATGVPGIAGNMEALSRAVLSKALPVSKTPFLPTSSDLADFFGGQATSPAAIQGRLMGDILSPMAWSKGASMLGAGGKALLAGSGPTDAAQGARAAGYVLPPNMASDSPGTVSSLLNSIGGKTKFEQKASIKNQPVTTNLAAQEVGLPADQKITPESLEEVRADAGKAYGAVRKAPIDVILGDKFKEGVANLNQAGAEVRAEAPELVQNPEIDQLQAALANKDKLSPAATVDLVRNLRAKAQANLKNYTDTNKTDLGRAQSKAASLLEGALEDNLQAATTARGPTGAEGGDMTAMLSDLQNARKTIAKTYDIEKALTPAGNVNAQRMAQIGKSRPLSGALQTIADMGGQFPKAMQPAERLGGDEKFSIMDLMAALGTHGKTLGLSLARPAARSGVLSDTYQNLIAGPRAGAAFANNSIGDMSSFRIDPKLLAGISPQILSQLLAQTQAPVQ